MTNSEKVVGVIGGMGPEATVEFLRRLVTATPANDDADHLHVIVDNNPKVPSRIKALIEGNGADPAPALAGMAQKLEAAGADFLVVPCNTAHHYLPAIRKAVRVPVLDVVDLTIAKLRALEPKPSRIGVLASPAVRMIGLFATRLSASGYEVMFPNEEDEAKLFAIIKSLKAGRAGDIHQRSYDAIAHRLSEQGADALLVACTELSLLSVPQSHRPVFDTLDLLVEATIRTARG
jgi:aspartate racemase